MGKNIFCIVTNEGDSNCIMSISCWRDIDSPNIVTYHTILNAFDGHAFNPHGILTTFTIDLGGKTILVEVKVVDAAFEYHLFLMHSLFYAIKVIVSPIFHVLHFPNQGKIVMIDHVSYCMPNLHANVDTNVSYVDYSPQGY